MIFACTQLNQITLNDNLMWVLIAVVGGVTLVGLCRRR